MVELPLRFVSVLMVELPLRFVSAFMSSILTTP
jgi:hypothetical protein